MHLSSVNKSVVKSVAKIDEWIKSRELKVKNITIQQVSDTLYVDLYLELIIKSSICKDMLHCFLNSYRTTINNIIYLICIRNIHYISYISFFKH